MRNKKSANLISLGLILIVTALVMLVRPFALRQMDRVCSEELISSIISPGTYLNDRDEMLKCANAYNRKIAAIQRRSGFIYRDTYEDPEYDGLLAGPAGMMCVLEIPEIDVMLPVGHGTGTELLSEYAGHLHGTSLPTGGPSTHAVIAAHAGLPDRELFTQLPRLEIGDEFHIYVLGEKHAYRIDKISEVLPSETELLDITGGEDYVTLMTCVPYGINTHRLFVRGVRE